MCLGLPGEILEISSTQPGLASVELVGVRRTINIELLDDVAPGDWVLVHVGYAMSKMDKDEARATLALLNSFLGGYGQHDDDGLPLVSDAASA